MAFGEVVFVVEDGDVSSDEAVGDVSSAVDVGSKMVFSISVFWMVMLSPIMAGR